nr:MAG TPA: hypothetical protein [Caudoviricetes sp.]
MLSYLLSDGKCNAGRIFVCEKNGYKIIVQ